MEAWASTGGWPSIMLWWKSGLLMVDGSADGSLLAPGSWSGGKAADPSPVFLLTEQMIVVSPVDWQQPKFGAHIYVVQHHWGKEILVCMDTWKSQEVNAFMEKVVINFQSTISSAPTEILTVHFPMQITGEQIVDWLNNYLTYNTPHSFDQQWVYEAC
ncbi:hypothetical protein DFS33DRAFT_1277588 [Desarmillaria ectypa]|nr:hypothetical protein DFS33DRAFT_1277588 [Desarmillaria ectypa]